MPTPDASQYTTFRRYASIAGDALGSVGSKISPFNTSYSIPMLSASSQALFLPSANKEKKFPPSVPGIPGPIWVRELGNGENVVHVYGVTTDPNDGTVIVCGETGQILFNGNVGDTYDTSVAFIARYTSSGTFISGTTLGTGTTLAIANAITTDAHGNIYICGQTNGDLSNSSTSYNSPKGFYAKLSSSFELLWVFELGSGWQYTTAQVIMVSPDGYLYIAGSTYDSDWYIDSPHGSYDYIVAFVVYCEPSTGEILNGTNYGSGEFGNTYITALTYIPISYGIPGYGPYIAICGYTQEDLGVLQGSVSDPGDGGTYGFLAFTFPDLYPLGVVGLGSGNHDTQFTCMTLATNSCGTFLWLGGGTNEYISYSDVGQGSLFEGGGYRGFVTVFILEAGFPAVSYVGDEQNYTAVTAILSDNFKFYVGGFTNENLDTGATYNGMVLTNFTLQTDFMTGYTDFRQIGTGTSFEILTGMESDTFGNFYVGGFTQEHLPNGPYILGWNGYVAKMVDQPKTYNTPIFMRQDVSENGGNGYFIIDYTTPVTIDWGDGTTQTITNGTSGGFTHTYESFGYYNIVVDAGTGGQITRLQTDGVGVLTLDVSRCPTLTNLRCDRNFLKSLNVSGCPNLETLKCNDNQLVSLDVSGLSSLSNLQFEGGDNAISTIHLEGCGLTDITSTTLEAAINDLNNSNSIPGRIYLDTNQETTYFDGDAADYFSGSLSSWTFVILPSPPPVLVADLSGLIFDGTGDPGHNYSHAFTFPSTNTVKVTFTNAPVSINQITHLQFQGPDGTIAPGDTFTVKNPTLTPSVASQDVGGNVYLYTNGSFPLTPSSEITLTTANAITSVTFSMN